MATIPGKFITIEGVEGVGKSTNIRFIKRFLQKNEVKVLTTREPGGTPLAEEIRGLLLSKREENVDTLAELLLIFAARSQHIETVIRPALAEGTWVICDRFTDATYAYQGGGRGVSSEAIAHLEGFVQKDLKPDLTILLDIDVEEGLRRATENSQADRFESEAIPFFKSVRDRYHEMLQDEPDRIQLVDAGQSLELVQSQIESLLLKILK